MEKEKRMKNGGKTKIIKRVYQYKAPTSVQQFNHRSALPLNPSFEAGKICSLNFVISCFSSLSSGVSIVSALWGQP